MKVKRLCATGLLALATAAGASAAMAAESGVYVGAGVGLGDVDASGYDNATSFKLFGGYDITNFFGVELAYVDLGKYKPKTFGNTNDIDGFQVSAVGNLRFNNNFTVFGKGGFYIWDLNGRPFGSDSGTDLTLGVGAQFMFNKNFGARTELEYFNDIGGGDIVLLSAGVVGHF